MRKTVIDQELAARGQRALTQAEFLLLLPHENWSVETAANMIMQLRRKALA